MRKRINTLDASLLLNGISYGEHVMNPHSVIKEVDELVQGSANAFIVRCNPEKPLSDEMYYALARYAKERGFHFGFLYAYQFPPAGQKSHLNEKLVRGIEKIAGDLFLGEFFGEAGSDKAAKDKGYYVEGSEVIALQKPPQNFKNVQEAKENFVRFIRSMTAYDDSIGLDRTWLVEATALFRYELEGGIRTPVLEVLPGNPETLIPFARGAAIGYGRQYWGGFIACEWYGGYRHEDSLKAARLELTYKYLYLSGANITLLESGNHEIRSFGYVLDSESDICRFYRETQKKFQLLIDKNPRLPCGPLAKVAFVAGNLDGYTDFMGGSAWCQFDREEWGNGDAEKSWKLLREVFRDRDWHDPASFAREGLDLNGSPAYGSYDVVPVESPLNVLKNYDYLIFIGWNTMTEELYDKLVKYVHGGGVLLMSCAHLSVNPERGGKREYVRGGDLSELFGCSVDGTERKNHGVKFVRDSYVPGLLYPGTSDFRCDANYTAGYVDYARVRLQGGTVRGMLSDSFFAPKEVFPAVIEYRTGHGTAILCTTENYPGNPAVYPLYSCIVKSILTASHANAELKVTGSDRVRYSLFFDDKTGEEELCFLNTSTEKAVVTIRYRGKKEELLLAPLELRILRF